MAVSQLLTHTYFCLAFSPCAGVRVKGSAHIVHRRTHASVGWVGSLSTQWSAPLTGQILYLRLLLENGPLRAQTYGGG